MEKYRLKKGCKSHYALKVEFGGKLIDFGFDEEGNRYESIPHWEALTEGSIVTVISDDLKMKFSWGWETLVVTKELIYKIKREAFFKDFEPISVMEDASHI